jgi:hypothetical protein
MLTDFTENKILDAIFGRRTWSGKPTTLFFSALTVGPADDGTGGTEVSGGGYARKGVAANTSEWSLATTLAGGTSNSNEIAWNMATASWGTISHIGIHTAATGGTMLAAIPLSSGAVVPAYTTLKLAAGDLDITMSGDISKYMANAVLNYLFRGTALPTIATFYVGLGTGTSEDFLLGEVSALTYNRADLPNTAGNFPVASAGVKTLALSADINFITAAANWGTLTHWGLYDRDLSLSAVASVSTVNNTITTSAAHGFVADDAVVFNGTTLPAELTAGTIYYVRANALTSTVFELATTVGGAAIDLTTAGTAANFKVSKVGNLIWEGALDNPLTVPSTEQVVISTGSLVLSLD